MGTLSGVDQRCAQTGTKLVCNLGNMARNSSTVVAFGIELPQAEQTLMVTASATTSSSENTLANNTASDIAALLNYDVAVTVGDVAINRHCTGQGLTSFFECALYSSSISSHQIEFLANGQLSIAPGYTGTWSQPTPDSLSFTSSEQGGGVVAEFEGYGTEPGCFEGITTFPGSSYVSPYEVCI